MEEMHFVSWNENETSGEQGQKCSDLKWQVWTYLIWFELGFINLHDQLD